ncbi:MAG TPA: TetR/AcrR family transcriptional regulator, partial [Dongiaceae bacterium]|nr:TetR/AcrR family transcriptional regulator [Dongiaceae bacterium]
AANDLFSRRGIRAVSVDSVIEKAGVAKPSLYRLFGSKDWLAIAYLERHEEDFWKKLDAIAALHPEDMKQRLLTLLDWIDNDISQPDYRGCPLTNAVVEYLGEDHPVRSAAIAHKRAIRQELAKMAQQMGALQPALLADQLFQLVEGARIARQLLPGDGDSGALAFAGRQLIEASLLPAQIAVTPVQAAE